MARPRNWLAVHAHFRTGAGTHGDARKARAQGVCRGAVDLEEWLEELEEACKTCPNDVECNCNGPRGQETKDA